MSPLITVTGADQSTRLLDLVRLAVVYPCVEVGLLYTETPEGRRRYPSREWLRKAVERLGKRCAVHICGRGARAEAMSGPSWIKQAGRVQVNGVVTPAELLHLSGLYPAVITQHNWKNPQPLKVAAAGHQMLVDASGGRGVSPTGWVRPATDKPVGFAGGLGPDNLHEELPRITRVARQPWWVDMEGKLRVDDWFSVALAEEAIQAFERFAALAESKATP